VKKGMIRPKLGDVFEISLGKGVAYAQYVVQGATPTDFKFLIRVFEGIFEESLQEPEHVCELEERFLAFYWLPAGLKAGLFRRVGSCPVPSRFKKTILDKDLPFSKWRIWRGKRVSVEDPLLPEHYDLSLMELVDTDSLIERIESRWHPRDEVFLHNPEWRKAYDERKKA
jgi:hypothetical protein